MYIAQCKVYREQYNVHFIMYTVYNQEKICLQCTEYHIDCTEFRIWYIGTVHRVLCTRYSSHSTVYKVQFTEYCVQGTVHIVLCTRYSSNSTVYKVQFTEYCVQGTVHIVLCTRYSSQSTVYKVQFT